MNTGVPAWREDDDALVEFLRPQAAVCDPPPKQYLDVAVAALSVRRFDATVAEVLRDSAWTTNHQPVGVRGPSGPRRLTLGLGGVAGTVEVDITRSRVVGWAEAEVLDAVECQTPEGSKPISISEHQRFAVLDAPPGPFSLIFHTSGGKVCSPWFLAS